MKWNTIIILVLYIVSASGQNLVVDGAPVLLPRLTSAERDLVSGVEGMLIFNSDTKKFEGFIGGGNIESVPPEAGMERNLGQYYIVLTPSSSGQLTSIELYSETGGQLGDLVVSSITPCSEPSVVGISNAVNTVAGWNTYNFAASPTLTVGNTYYISTNSGSVLANLSQSDLSGLSLGLRDGGNSCTGQAGELAMKIHLSGNWMDLN